PHLGGESDIEEQLRLDTGAIEYHKYLNGGARLYMIISRGKIDGKNNPALSTILGEIAKSRYNIPSDDLYLEKRLMTTN
ncbi:MAG: hypothetical protein OQK82_01425, partial [Candidatus Pacearchaeota archaeon]|nr:hypothetical protein [Candidatus Pacearchaeota archaeon]